MSLTFSLFFITGLIRGEPSLFCLCKPRQLTYLGSGAKLWVGGITPFWYVGRLLGLGLRKLPRDKGSLGGTTGGLSSSTYAPDKRRRSPVLSVRGGTGGGTSALSVPFTMRFWQVRRSSEGLLKDPGGPECERRSLL